MKILYLDSVDSTQNYLKELLKKEQTSTPIAVVAEEQTNGIGSRDNRWTGMNGNLFLSFAISLEDLPQDLKLESASIYFAYILKETLNKLNSEVWLKWPNDFYIDDKKIGGMITHLVKDKLICGIGLNLVNSPEGFSKLDVKISRDELLNKYFESIEKKFSWKQIFSKYKLEFHRNKCFFTHDKNSKVSLDEAKLQNDGSIIVDGKRMYSLR